MLLQEWAFGALDCTHLRHKPEYYNAKHRIAHTMIDATQTRASISATTFAATPILAIHVAKHPHPSAEKTGKDSKHLIERGVDEHHTSRYFSEQGRCSNLKTKIVAVTAIAFCAKWLRLDM